MARRKKSAPSSDLSELVRKFARNDVIAELEKEYQTLSSREIPLSSINDSPFVRKAPLSQELVQDLGKSIREKGIFSPLLVRPCGSHFELVLGRKRYFGAKEAGLLSLPCLVFDLSDEETLLMILADSRDQRDSNVVEMALLYEELETRFHYDKQTLADLSHSSRSQVTNALRLLTLPDYVIREVSTGKLSYGHARALVPLSEEEIRDAVRIIHREKLSVRETERLAKTYGIAPSDVDLEVKVATLAGAEKTTIGKKGIYLRFLGKSELDKFIASLEQFARFKKDI